MFMVVSFFLSLYRGMLEMLSIDYFYIIHLLQCLRGFECRGSDSSLFEMRNALTFKLVLFIYCLFRVTCHCIQRTHFIPDFFCCCSSGLWTTESSR